MMAEWVTAVQGNLSQLFGRFVQFNAAQLQGGGGSGLGLWRT